jgi:hypothetical protein
MNDDLEPWIPPDSGMDSNRPEYRIAYRDPQTGDEYFRLANSVDVWMERRQLEVMGYQVAVQERWVHITAWKITEKTR